jgi:hypothetical protein
MGQNQDSLNRYKKTAHLFTIVLATAMIIGGILYHTNHADTLPSQLGGFFIAGIGSYTLKNTLWS